ncbi:MaoC family dehydratase [Metallosphaera tengchongensis]|uniref:MaoC family dehydratase n=2 Tax=Metallosphaera tengchongensis TaxID=1532350 RepID=A0A6N0P0K0_9CREN|nr:MaoC family dehydratase [Metallosphaera tengchongensis]
MGDIVVFGAFGPFFEDFEIGMKIKHRPCRTVSQYDNVLWSALTLDYTPLYLDETYASLTSTGRISINPRFVHSLVVGLSTRDTSLNTMAFLGVDYEKLHAPVFPGDTLCVESEVVTKRESKRPNVGVVSWVVRAFNQKGEIVYETKRSNLIYKRQESPWIKYLEARDLVTKNRENKDYRRDPIASQELSPSHPGWWGRFLEDFSPGQVMIHRIGRTVYQYDNLLSTVVSMNVATLHFDSEYMLFHEYGEPVVQGPLVVGIACGISSTELGVNLARDLGIRELKLTSPVFDGDTLHAKTEILGAEPLETTGIVRAKTTVFKDNFSKEVGSFVRELEIYRKGFSPWVKIWKE